MTNAQAAPAANFDADDFRARYHQLLGDLNVVLFERTNEILGTGLAALGKLNVFMVGPPGLAKSMLPREFVKRISLADDEDFFDMQFNRTTVPEEMLGPFSLKALEDDRYARNPARRLPHARVALLDEFFKGSSAILNVGLKMLEERQWDNDGRSNDIPLWFAICPSNECPTDAEFAAISDRLPLRFQTDRLRDDANFVGMLEASVARHLAPVPQTFVSVGEIEQAQVLVRHVTVPNTVMHSLADLRRNLDSEAILQSDRRYVKAVQVLQAHAWLDGRDTVTTNDFRVLRHVLWSDPEHIRTVDRLVLDVANPMDREASELLEEIESLSTNYDRSTRDAATHEEKVRHTLEAFSKLRAITEREKSVRSEAKSKDYSSDMLDELRSEIKKVSAKLKSGFGMPDMDGDDLDD